MMFFYTFWYNYLFIINIIRNLVANGTKGLAKAPPGPHLASPLDAIHLAHFIFCHEYPFK